MKSIFNIGDFVQTPRGFYMVENIEIVDGEATVYLSGKEEIDDCRMLASELEKAIIRHVRHRDGRAAVNFFELAFAK